jgi:hypothetical protein
MESLNRCPRWDLLPNEKRRLALTGSGAMHGSPLKRRPNSLAGKPLRTPGATPGNSWRPGACLENHLDSATLPSHTSPKRKRGHTLRQIPRWRVGLVYSPISRQSGAAQLQKRADMDCTIHANTLDAALDTCEHTRRNGRWANAPGRRGQVGLSAPSLLAERRGSAEERTGPQVRRRRLRSGRSARSPKAAGGIAPG